MSLITIQRSPTPQGSTDSSSTSENDGVKSQSEDFFASKGTAVLQNQIGRRRSSVIQEGDTIQSGLKKALSLLRKEDSLKLIVNLEKANPNLEGYRYFCVISSNGKQDTEEFLILGVDIFCNNATIGLVLPICQDMSVALDGDGGFKVKNKDGDKLFKPTSVHALWSTVQLLNKTCSIAREHNYYMGGLSHTWIGLYMSKITSNRAQVAEWNKMIDADSITNSNLAPKSAISEYVIGTQIDESVRNKDEIRKYLKDIMRDEDMDIVTVIELREQLQKKVTFSLKEYRSFIAEEILIICGQMDSASEILPHLFLGSTYNASNLEELLNNKITHILNVTRETENFFRETFTYRNVEVFDCDTTDLLNYFNDCYQFINSAKSDNSACFVHCQRGISRSATVVIAYMMKEFNLTCDQALKEVKNKRECVHPNDGFMTQLKTYEGMLKAKRDFYSLFSKEIENLKLRPSEKRKKIMSVPNEIYELNEKDVESPTNSCPVTDSRQSITHYDSTLQYSSDFSSLNTVLIESSLLDNGIPSDIKSIDLPSKVDIHDHLLMYKPYNNDISQDDCLFRVNREADSTSILLKEIVPADCQIMTNDYHRVISTIISPEIFTSTRLSIDNNVNDTYRMDPTDNNRRSLRLKGDDSWIKLSDKITDAKSGDQAILPLRNTQASMDRSSNYIDLFESGIVESTCDVDIDKQSLRPVRELLSIYNKEN